MTKFKTLIALSIVTAVAFTVTANAESYSPVPQMRERAHALTLRYEQLYDQYYRTTQYYMRYPSEQTYYQLGRMVSHLDAMHDEITHLNRVIYWYDTQYQAEYQRRMRPTGTVASNLRRALVEAQNTRVAPPGDGPVSIATSRGEALRGGR